MNLGTFIGLILLRQYEGRPDALATTMGREATPLPIAGSGARHGTGNTARIRALLEECPKGLSCRAINERLGIESASPLLTAMTDVHSYGPHGSKTYQLRKYASSAL